MKTSCMPEFLISNRASVTSEKNLVSRPRCGSLQCFPDTLAVYKGPVSKGRKGKGGMMRRGVEEQREGRVNSAKP